MKNVTNSTFMLARIVRTDSACVADLRPDRTQTVKLVNIAGAGFRCTQATKTSLAGFLEDVAERIGGNRGSSWDGRYRPPEHNSEERDGRCRREKFTALL